MTAYGNLQLCTALRARKEGATHAMEQRRIKKLRKRRRDNEEDMASD